MQGADAGIFDAICRENGALIQSDPADRKSPAFREEGKRGFVRYFGGSVEEFFGEELFEGVVQRQAEHVDHHGFA